MDRPPRTALRRERCTCGLTVLIAASATLADGGQRRRQSPPFELTVKLLIGGEIFGPVLDHSDDLLVLDYAGAPCAVTFNELKVGSAYRAKKALLARARGGTDRLTAEDHLELGRYALQRNHPALANNEFKLADNLDGSYGPRIDAARKEYRERHRAATPTGPPSRLDEKLPDDQPGALPGLTETFRQKGPLDRQQVIDLYKRFGQSVRDKINRDLVLIETDHFLIWTDWNRIHRPRLAQWCESMYRALSAQFGLGAEENIFLGKCPVFCFRNKARFLRFAQTYDHYNRTSVNAYTRTDSCGHVHVVLFRRGSWDYEIDRFAGTLVHEGVHAFLHRYRRIGHISGWVGEGLADYIAEQVLDDCCPFGERAELVARQYVLRDIPIQGLLRKNWQPHAHEYPIACSVVGFLVERDSDHFSAFIGDLKAGYRLEQALQRNYDGMTFKTLEAAWRDWIRSKL